MNPRAFSRYAVLLTATALLAACNNSSDVSPALTVNFLGEGSGTVEVQAADVTAYREDVTAPFAAGETVRLTAAADDGSVFEGWDGDCSDPAAPSCEVVMNADKAVRATFAEKTFVLTLAQAGSGSGTVRVLEAGEEVALCRDACEVALKAGSAVTLQASPDSGAVFTGWAGDCSGTTCQLTLDAPKTVTALFDTVSPDPSLYTLEVLKAGSGSGAVTSNPTGIECGSDCESDFLAGSTVILSARENAGSVFTGWQNCPAPAASSCSVTLSSNAQVTATFNRGGGAEKKIVVPVRRPSDDAEQYLSAVNNVPREKGPDRNEDFPANAVDIKSGDIDLTYNTDFVDTDQLIGLRFTDLGIPPKATILDARIQFTVDHETSGYVKLYVYGQANPQALTFVHQGVGDISSRPRTSEVAVWEPPPWLSKEGTRRDPAALTPNLAKIVQEVNDLPGWQQSSNGLVFVIEGDPLNGTNRRRATSFEDSDTESQLIVTYLD